MTRNVRFAVGDDTLAGRLDGQTAVAEVIAP